MKTAPHWEKIGQSPHHGICVPLFSLHTQKSSGIGEYLDLLPLIDWVKSIHFDCIQLLPINDTGTDPSPYNAVSSCALDPVYLSLHELGLETQIPKGPRIDVLNQKLGVLFTLFQKTFPTLSKTAAYQTFLNENPWLPAYARFKVERNSHKEIDFYPFLQYHAFRQMKLAHDHATKQGVFLKGDIPILLNPDSTDVVENPAQFHLDLNAGAPPDLYNRLGQNWGFPLFNWDEMRKTGFQWWKRRLKTIQNLYHIYRIDHVVGFFRIWGIPKGAKAAEGSFFPPDQKLWAGQGRELLTMMIDASPLLPMAEDLGTIPKEVYPILKELGICGTKVVRWEKKEGHFTPFKDYEPLSLTTLSTHDMDTLELWWKKTPAESVPFAQFMGIQYHPLLSPKDRLKILTEAHHSASLFHINLLQEYLALFPELVWPNPEEERINVPGTLLPGNWTYRFRPSIEEIAAHTGLREAMLSFRIS